LAAILSGIITYKFGGIKSVNLKVAEKYVEAFSGIAREGNPLVLPGKLADVGCLVATAMSIAKSQLRELLRLQPHLHTRRIPCG
jgi:hypothetical protein